MDETAAQRSNQEDSNLSNLLRPPCTKSPAYKKLEAQAWKINMHFHMMGNLPTRKNRTAIGKRHRCGKNDFFPTDVIEGAAENSWWVICSDAAEESMLVTYNAGTDIQCECVDYPCEYVCMECKICIHMYTCSCREVDEFPSLICKHIHAVIQHGEGVVQKQDITKHILTPHRTPGHKWPDPIIYRFKIVCGKRGSPKTLVPVSTESVWVNEDSSSEEDEGGLVWTYLNKVKILKKIMS
ncbi:unnamed protein product [Meganyctiphanes norvegica]|uniref:SWIM-type domain-containing protein n=1 Tax=Meganyctiphanes norvegica TaxID=48144 RepID=A0AAV2SGF9_MEGNR